MPITLSHVEPVFFAPVRCHPDFPRVLEEFSSRKGRVLTQEVAQILDATYDQCSYLANASLDGFPAVKQQTVGDFLKFAFFADQFLKEGFRDYSRLLDTGTEG